MNNASSEATALTADKIKADTISNTAYVLSDIEREFIQKLEADGQQAASQAAQRAAQETLAPFNARSEGVLMLIYRQQGLSGNWKLSEDKTRLVSS